MKHNLINGNELRFRLVRDMMNSEAKYIKKQTDKYLKSLLIKANKRIELEYREIKPDQFVHKSIYKLFIFKEREKEWRQ